MLRWRSPSFSAAQVARTADSTFTQWPLSTVIRPGARLGVVAGGCSHGVEGVVQLVGCHGAAV